LSHYYGMGLPFRSDAIRRRQQLLDAAAAVFAAHGYGAPLDSIAARAGVGQGTLYRNFTDRDELLAALIDRDLAELEAALAEVPLVEHPFALIEAMAEHSVLNPGMCEYWLALPPDSPHFLAGQERFFRLARRGLAEAVAAGRLRPDLSAEDLGLVGVMLRAIHLGLDEAERRRTKQRVLSILTHGIAP